MTIELNGKMYKPLSMIANNQVGLNHPVYVTDRWCQFYNNGKLVARVVRLANGFFKYVTFNNESYYIDDACTLR